MNVHRRPYRPLVWVLTLAVASVLALGTEPAGAACVPTSPSVITCTGDDGKYDAGGAEGLTVNVQTFADVEYVRGLRNSQLNINLGIIGASNTSEEPSVQGKDNVEINILGTVSHNHGGTAIRLEGDGNFVANQRLDFSNRSVIRTTGNNSVGLHIEGENSKVVNDGNIVAAGSGAAAIHAQGVTIENEGDISGKDGGTGIRIADTSSVTIIDNGWIIEGETYSIHSLGGAVNISNAWTIMGDIFLSDSGDTLHNTGLSSSISGTVDLGGGNNSLINDGFITGEVKAGAGNDTMINRFSLSKSVHLGDGKNTLDNEFWIGGAVFGGDGVDTVTNHAEASIGGVALGGGRDKFINYGTVRGDVDDMQGVSVDMGKGNDELINEGAIIGNVDMGGGRDTLVNRAWATIEGDVDMGAGNDTLINERRGTITGDINMGAGNDILTNERRAAINGNINTGAGNDTLINERRGTITGDIHMGADNDTLINERHATIDGNIRMGTGDDALINERNATITGNVNMGAGNDTLTNEGHATIDGNIRMGTGDDALINERNATIIGNVNMGAGNDTLTNERLGTITGNINTGAGNDTLINDRHGSINGNINMGADDDAVQNRGIITGVVNLGDGNDLLENSGTISGVVRLGDGNAGNAYLGLYTLHNTGTIDNGVVGGTGNDAIHNESVMGSAAVIRGGIQLIAGTNTVQNSGEIYGGVTGGTGDDHIANSNVVYGNVHLGDADVKNVLDNSGTIHGSVIGGEAKDEVRNTSSFTIYGDVNLGGGDDLLQNTGVITGVVRTGAGGDVVTNEDGGDIRTGIVLGNGTNTVTNEGIIGQGITDIGDGWNIITNTSSGTIHGTVNLGDGSNTLLNSGLIDGNYFGGAGTDSITNLVDGVITGGVELGDGSNTLVNHGKISGSVTGGSDNDHNDHVENHNTIGGTVNLGDGTNTFLNNGLIDGNYLGGAGADYITNLADGLIAGGVELGDGSNTVVNHGKISGGVTGGSDNDHNDYVGNHNTIGGTVNLGDGHNTFFNSGLIDGAYLGGAGVDYITNNTGGLITGGVDLGDGSNTLVNHAEIGGSVKGTGRNSLENYGRILQSYVGGDDTDIIANEGFIGGIVHLGAGSNRLLNLGEIAQAITGGDDDDQVENNGTIGDTVNLGDGFNTLVNSSLIDGSYLGGGGNDVITNEATGHIVGIVDMGDGTNTLTNRGIIGASVVGGDGVNTIINSGLIGGSVDLGNGSSQLLVEETGTVQGNVTARSGSHYVGVFGHVFGNIWTNSGYDSVLVGPDGLVTGDVLLGDGNDQLILQGWDGNHLITGVRDGGGGDEDRLILDGGAGTLLTSDFLNFENISVRNQGEWTISGSIPTTEGVVTSSHLPALWLLGDGNHVTYADGSAITVDADGGTGVSISGNDNVLIVNGDVDVTGASAAGIRILGLSNVVTNNSSESIVVAGVDSVGVTITGDSNEFGNVGTVRFAGLRSTGVWTGFGSGNTITNHGTGAIIGEGNDAVGVVIGGSHNTLTNIGSITLSGANSVGALAVGADNTIVNDGNGMTASGNSSAGAILQGTGHYLDNLSLIGASGNTARGVIVNGPVGDDNVITNTGTIRAELANSVGVQTTGDGVTRLTNHGVVEARQHTGIPGVYNYFHSIVGGDGSEIITNYGTLHGTVNLGGGDDELMLMAGSHLEHGHILMGDGNDTLVYSTLANDIGPAYEISGGSGNDTLRLTDNGVVNLYDVADFETLELKDDGTWIFHRSVAFDNHIVIDDGDAGHLKLMGVQFDTGGLTVGKAATLSGTGTITGDVTVKGVIRPGHSHGTLNIDGDYNQADDSTYELELATDGTSDLIHATGAATIGDDTTLEITAEYGYFDPTHRFRIIEADGGVTGEFDNVAWDINLLFLAPEANTEGDNVYVDLVHSGPSFASVAKTTNQKAIAEALDQAESLGEGADVINLVLPALDEDDARQAYGSLSGEIYTQHRAASLSSMRAFTRSAADTIGSLSEGQRIWAAAYGGNGDVPSQGDLAGAKFRHKGFVAGWAPLSTDSWRVGVMAGMGDIDVNMPDRESEGAADSRRFGLYAHYDNGATSFTAQFASGSDTFTVDRRLALLGHPYDDRLAAGNYRSNSTAFTLEGSVTYATGKYDIRPTFGLGVYSLTRPAFTETGAGAANLVVQEDEYSVTQGAIGITVSQATDEGRTNVPELRLGFVANSGQFESAFSASFPDAPGAPFTVKGATPGDSAFVIGATLRGGEGRVSYELAYDAEFWGPSTHQTVHGKVSFSF